VGVVSGLGRGVPELNRRKQRNEDFRFGFFVSLFASVEQALARELPTVS